MKNLHLNFLLSTLALFFSLEAVAKKWSDDDYNFHYSEFFLMSQSPTNQECHILRRVNKEKTDGFFLKICKIQSDFHTVLKNSVFFRQDGKWMASGSMDAQLAIRSKMPNGSELIETKTPPSCGIKDVETGFHAAGGQCYRAYVGNGNSVISLESDGVDKDFATMRKVTRSVSLKIR